MCDIRLKNINHQRGEPFRRHKDEGFGQRMIAEVNAYEKLKNSPRGPGLNSIGN